MPRPTIADVLKVGTITVAVIVGATTTTIAVKANTHAVNQLTESLRDQGNRITELEKWRIEETAYARAAKDFAESQEQKN